MLVALLAATAFSPTPQGRVTVLTKGASPCVSSSPAEVLAAAQAVIGQSTEVQILQAEAAGVDLNPPKTCAEVEVRGLCAVAAQAGLECCECPDGFIVSAESPGYNPGQDASWTPPPNDDEVTLPCEPNCVIHCHPAASTVELEQGTICRMDELVVGDRIRTNKGFEPVTALVHADANTHAEYYRFSTTAGKTLHIAPRHYLFANGKEVDPATVKIGDELHMPGEETTAVTDVSLVVAQGVFHLFVPSGAYYVDGLLASDYLDFFSFKGAQEVGRCYVAARYYLGVPIKMHGVLDVTKLSSGWAAASHLPWLLQLTSVPLLFLGVVAAELVNLTAGNALAAVMLAAFGLGCVCWRKAGKPTTSLRKAKTA